ncbi:MAG: adenosylcobinamide-GDP ribazoletransferase [Methylococcales bacterium]|nr:adenosylcobinamide-GDP ribazoletransferase [Methylococcaceae bacterium]
MPKIKLFFLALTFYTRLPSPIALDYKDLPKAAVYFPLIGWLVGGMSALSFYLADYLWPQSSAVIIAIITGILITGAFHEDGFSDVCDGFGGGYGKQRILDIMKDSRIGVYGAAGLLLILLLKISLLSETPAHLVPLLLFSGHSLSRLMPLILMQRDEYARENDSKVSSAVYRLSPLELASAITIALLPLLLLPNITVLAILPVWLVNLWLGHYFNRHIGGYTGDCLGASQQIAETVFYLSATAIWALI